MTHAAKIIRGLEEAIQMARAMPARHISVDVRAGCLMLEVRSPDTYLEIALSGEEARTLAARLDSLALKYPHGHSGPC